MYQDFPSTHPFAQCAASSSYIAPTPLPKPSITGPVPPRRSRPVISHTQSDSSISTTSTISSTLLLTPTSSRSTTPALVSENEEDESAFFARLSITSKQFGTSRRRSSQHSLPSESFEAFVAEMEGKGQFGSVARRGGVDLEERHERLAQKLEAEVEGAEIRLAVKVRV